MDDKFIETFLEETNDLLSNLEDSLLELEANQTDQASVDEIFRIVHTIKGTSAMFGFQKVSEFIHQSENILDRIRKGERGVDKELIDLILQVKDIVGRMINSPTSEDDTEIVAETLVERLKAWSGEGEPENPPAGESSSTPKMEEGPREEAPGTESQSRTGSLVTYRIRFKPDQNIFFSGIRPLSIVKELIQLGESTVVAYTNRIPRLDVLDPEKCYLQWDIFLRTHVGINEIRDVFIFVEDKAEIDIDVIDEENGLSDESPDYKKLGEILVERKLLSSEALHEELVQHVRLGESLVDKGLVDRTEVDAALVEQQFVRKIRSERDQNQNLSSIKVKSEKLDNMIDLIGELVTLQARLDQTAQEKSDLDLGRLSEDFERITTDLRDNAMNIRMVPIGSTFNKFRRLVRDLSADLKKEVEFLTEGADTELDKSVIEKLNDPLIHLIRNSLDHGVELPQERRKVGKEGRGFICLSSEHEGANVLIRVTDDGRGLDRDKILSRAVSRGLVPEGMTLSNEEIYALIFEPGFSTNENVSRISGRGVGLDVVKRSIEALSGQVEVSSKPGLGTEFVLRIPLTLAIIDGLLVTIGGSSYVIPLIAVDRCLEIQNTNKKKRDIENLAGEMLPFIDLRDFFEIDEAVPEIRNIVVINHDGKKVGLVIDKVIGENQTVIKSLGRLYTNAEGISGATILGDGSIALILDVQKIVDRVRFDQAKTGV